MCYYFFRHFKTEGREGLDDFQEFTYRRRLCKHMSAYIVQTVGGAGTGQSYVPLSQHQTAC